MTWTHVARASLRVLPATVFALLLLTASAQAAATATVGFSADPSVDKPVTVTVSGSTSAPRRLYVTIQRSATCGALVFGGADDVSLGGLYRDVSGTFSETYAFTPASTEPYVLCAYVTTHQVDVPDVLARGVVAARRANAQAVVVTSADPTVGAPVAVTVSGSSEVPRRLYVTNQPGGTCATTVFGTSGAHSLGDLYRDVSGAFSETYAFTPSSTAPNVLCAYVAVNQDVVPDALVGLSVSARAPRVSAQLSVAADAPATRPLTFSVAGTSELSGKLYVRWALSEGAKEPSDCGTSVYGPKYVVTKGLDVRPVVGDYRETYTITPPDEGVVRLCAYALPGGGDPDAAGAVATADVQVGTPIDPPVLLGPDDRAAGKLLNPTFSWRTGVDVEDTLLLARVALDGTVGVPVRFTATSYSGGDLTRAPGSDEDDDEGKGGDIDDIATYRNDGTVTSLRLDHGLVPGRYAWAVLRDDGIHTARLSDERAFDVQGPPLTRLDVSDHRWSGTSSRNPGETQIRIGVTAYAQVTLRLTRRGHTAVRRFEPSNATLLMMMVRWSCTKPGGTYRYTVTATDQYGTRKTRSGAFRPVTSARCSSMRRAESARRRARDAAARRREAARQRAEERAQANRIARYKRNCRKLGGTPVWLDGDGVRALYCRGPLGGLIYVP